MASALEELDALLSVTTPTPIAGGRKKFTAAEAGVRERNLAVERSRLISAASRDIGPIPECVNPEFRTELDTNLRLFLETILKRTFQDPWADYHYELISTTEAAIKSGGWYAKAVPRGGGKTVICTGAALWAMASGWRSWPVLIGATDDFGLALFRDVRTEAVGNTMLLDYYPEIFFPFARLEGQSRRSEGQTCNGIRTGIEYSGSKLVFPTLPQEVWGEWAYNSFGKRGLTPPCQTFGTRLTYAGLTGAIRGKSEKTLDLRQIRPDLAIVDDPQTRESASSNEQIKKRHQILVGDVGFMAGPTSPPLAMIVPCTVIVRNDLAERLLDPDTSPEFASSRYKMVSSFPTDMSLWDEYADIRRDCIRRKAPLKPANDFYQANRMAMDEGCVVTWPHRKQEGDLSAIQSAMNLKYKDEEAFWAEAQNEPLGSVDDTIPFSRADQTMHKQRKFDRREVPTWAERIVAHVDVHGGILFYCVTAASLGFECQVIDYGTFPGQNRWYFSTREPLRTMAQQLEITVEETALFEGVKTFLNHLGTLKYRRGDGVEMGLDYVLTDVGWMPSEVIKAGLESNLGTRWLPSQGLPVGAKDTPFAFRGKKAGEEKGQDWFYKPKPDAKHVRYLQMDANAWKVNVHSWLLSPSGPGSINLWQDKPERHRMFAEHVAAEKPKRVTVGDRTKIEFVLPGNADNHYLDTLYGSLVGLSFAGCVLPGHTAAIRSRRVPKVVSRASLGVRNG